MDFALNGRTLVISVGKGEAFAYSELLRDTITKDPIDLSAKTFVGKVATAAGVEVATITASGNASGILTLSAGSTEAWPVGDLKIDLLMNPDGVWVVRPGTVVRVAASATFGG